MAKKKRGDAHGGGHGWFVTFADLMGLMMSFFVMLVAFSTMDNNKLKIVAGSMRDAFGVQTEARYSGIIESDGLPTRPKLKNVDHISPDESSNTPTPDQQDRNQIAGAQLKIDREFVMNMDLGLSDDPDESFRLFQGRILEEYEKMIPEFGLTVIDATLPIETQQQEMRLMVLAKLTQAKQLRVAP